MPKKKQEYAFSSRLVPLDHLWAYMGVIIPMEIIDQLPKGRIRAKGKLNNYPFDLGVNYLKSGERYFMLSKLFRKAAGIRQGELVNVRFELADVQHVELPEELEAAIAQDEEAAEHWKQFTPGIQRSLAHYVKTAKSIDVRIKRSLELMHKIKTRQLSIQKTGKTPKVDS